MDRLRAKYVNNAGNCGRFVKGVMVDGRIFPVLAVIGEDDSVALAAKLGVKRSSLDLSRFEIYAARQPREI